MYVIQRTDQGGGYVADMRKSTGSYTKSITKAQLFTTREQAERNKCPGNEVVIDVGYNDILNR